ncbi:MAG: hypothetical protein ACT4R6_08510 [Gemmatimonadaceae bacterium]
MFLAACTQAPARSMQGGRGSSSAAAVAAERQRISHDAEVTRDLEVVRAATAPFRDLAAAQAAGWPNSKPACLANELAGGMGHHYVNRAHVDDRLELARPEILLYAPAGEGRQKLVAVEYVIPYRLLSPDSEAPRILGQPLKRSDELKLWYLHVWAWEENPAGLFADWNPNVKC